MELRNTWVSLPDMNCAVVGEVAPVHPLPKLLVVVFHVVPVPKLSAPVEPVRSAHVVVHTLAAARAGDPAAATMTGTAHALPFASVRRGISPLPSPMMHDRSLI